jgi:hypothetical protein
VEVTVGENNLLIGQCAHPDFVDDRVKIDSGICESVN